MRIITAKNIAGVSAIALAGWLGNASAQTLNSELPAFYVGGNYGLLKARGGQFEDEANLMEAVAGLKFNPFFGLEGSYTHFGEYGGEFASASLGGYGLSAQGSLPLSGTTNVYAKAGMFFSSLDIELANFSESYTDRQPFYGLGVDFAVFNPVVVSLEYDRYKVVVEDENFPINFDSSDTDVDTVKVGVKFVF